MGCEEVANQQPAAEESEKQRSLLRFLNLEQRALLEARRPICAGCSQNKGLGEVTVRCEAVGCAGVSLFSGRCKRRKWPV